MKQLALDIGLPTGPSLERFYAGRNAPVAQHVRAWVFERQGGHMPVPTYVWGESGAGKTHLLQAVRQLHLVDIVLVLAHAYALGIDLDQLGERVLHAARDGDGGALLRRP